MDQAICKDNIPYGQKPSAHDEYQSYYFSQCRLRTGRQPPRKMYPNEPKDSWLTWSKYRDVMYPYLREQQAKEGAWAGMGSGIGPVFTSSVNLAILQLEKGCCRCTADESKVEGHKSMQSRRPH